MRLFEVEHRFGSLPKTAGDAKLDWVEGRPVVTRKGKCIILPNSDDTQFFPLLDGVQFLVQTTVDGGKVFFGGTDEQPFLVELQKSVVTSLRGGEGQFFDTIKPHGAKVLEKAFGTEAVRQGDWFAVPMPLAWKAVVGIASLISRFVVDGSKHKEQKIQLGRTRHELLCGYHIDLSDNSLRCRAFGEGILKAPDHKDRVLKGPHAFFQTAYLVDPIRAD